MPDLLDAVRSGDVVAVRAALHAGPVAAAPGDAGGVSPVCIALYHGHQEVADVLAGARGDHLTIHEAAALGDTAALERILDVDPVLVRALSADGFTALHLAAFLGRPVAVGRLLLAGADVEAMADNPMRVRPLHSAAAARRTDVVRLLLAAGADPNAAQQHGWRPLHAAAHNGDLATLDALLLGGADPALLDDDGAGPADLARAAGHRTAADLLG